MIHLPTSANRMYKVTDPRYRVELVAMLQDACDGVYGANSRIAHLRKLPYLIWLRRERGT
jgi:hypothetical protein